MSFTPVVIDATPAASESSEERPVYVYGQSGRCWKFKNVAVADAYFDKLTLKQWDSEFLTDIRYLVDRYDESILKRISLAYDHFPIKSESNDDEINITHKGKRTNAGHRKYTYYYKKANISITCDKEFSVFSIEPLQYLFPDHHKFHGCISVLTRNTADAELLIDYVLGDRVRYTEPRILLPQTQRWGFLNIFRTSPSYTPIRVDLHID